VTGQAIVTPEIVEKRLVTLSRELDAAHNESVLAESAYFDAKAAYEIGIASARMKVGAKFADMGVKVTVQEREDEALLATADLLKAYYRADALQRASKANVQRIRTQTDIARTIAASVRTSMDLS
jgi:hypothetical protein